MSSSESLGSETGQNFSRLSVNDLKIHGVGSVLLNALTSPAVSAPCPANRKRDISRCGSESNLLSHRQEETISAPATDTAKCPFKARKLESPSDSGIDSPKAQGSQSTNTSVCSSPRSSMEEKVKEVEEEQAAKPEVRGDNSLEEQHPLLKRALQQPPQPFNAGGVTNFQDEVYKPHKKFRHSGRKDSDEPTSTQESATSPTPSSESSQAASHSILASQLAAPPTYSSHQNSSSPSQSLLASTLSRPIAVPRAKEAEKRNEWLANFILDKGRPGPSSSTGHGLLMCAPLPAHSHIPGYESLPPWARPSGPSSPAPAPSAPRHIPVPVAPTPSSSSPRTGSGPNPGKSEATKNPHLKMALAGAVSSYEAPLNLSTKSGTPAANVPAEA